MFKILGNKRLFILLAAFIVFFALMGLTLGDRSKLTWPEKFFKDTVSFTQGLIYKPAAHIAGFFRNVAELRAVYEENQALKSRMMRYVKDTARLNALEEQNKRLEDALRFTDEQRKYNQYKWRIAQVISQSPDPLNRTVNIDLGEKDGIKPDMAVATTDGLVGRVVKVAEFYSTVQLLTDSEYNQGTSKAIAATVKGKETESFGIIESYDSKTGYLIMDKIKDVDPMKVGDTVITSRLGGVFPEGLVVGTVMSRKVGEFGITHTAMIKPAASFDRLREVFVVDVPTIEVP